MITSEVGLDAVVSGGFAELRDHRDAQVKILVNPSA